MTNFKMPSASAARVRHLILSRIDASEELADSTFSRGRRALGLGIVPQFVVTAVVGVVVVAGSAVLIVRAGNSGSTPAGASASVATMCPNPQQEFTTKPSRPGNLVKLDPFEAVICSYGQVRNTDKSVTIGQLGAVRLVDEARLRKLVEALNSSSQDWALGMHNCPDDTGERVDILFSASAGREVVSIWLSGCAHASNGSNTNAKVSQSVLKELRGVQ